jgi:2-methylcitrate dehydratase PrpD
VRLKDGRLLHARSAEHYRGGPKAPLSQKELVEKFNDASRHVLSPDQARKLLDSIESLEKLDSIRRMLALAAGHP